MSGPELWMAVGEAFGHLLGIVVAWAALFTVGPIACLVLLALHVAGVPTPPGSGWVYVATAAAWVTAYVGWLAARAAARAGRSLGGALERFATRLRSGRPPRRQRVIVVDAATGTPVAEQPGWEWGAARDAEFREWASAAARARAAARQRAAASSVPPEPTPPPPAPPRGAAERAAAGSSRRAAPPPREAPPRAQRPVSPPPPPPPRAPAPPPAPDAWAVLGVPRTASQDAIRTAYRELIKQYHPDRVAGMPKEFQAIAHEKTREIREAYETLRRRDRH